MKPEHVEWVHEQLVETNDLYANVIDAAGGYDAKVDPSANCSLAAHLLNAVTVGVNTFLYEAVGDGESIEEYEEEINVLAAALALHDTDKYLREVYGCDFDRNTAEAFDYYFDPDGESSGDDFGIEAFLGEGYREDLLYLVQRTERHDASEQTRASDSEFGALFRYCRIGDRAASKALESGVEGVYSELEEKLGSDEVHVVQFTALEQPLLNDILLGTVKRAITGELDGESRGVVIGSSPESVLYLGDEMDRDRLRELVAENVSDRVTTDFDFECKLTWNSFGYEVLDEIALDVEEKEGIIAEQVRELFRSGTADVEPFETIPEEFDNYSPYLVRALYIENKSTFADGSVQSKYDEIVENKDIQKVKTDLIEYVIKNFDNLKSYLDDLADEVRPRLHDDLEPESDALGTTVERFFEGQTVPDLTQKAETCFLCGSRATQKYQKGQSAIYRTQEYSRRVPPHAKYKSICEVCNMEYALLASVCEDSGVRLSNDIEVAYFYMDDFLGDIRVRSQRIGNIVQDDADELDDTEVTKSLVGSQYFLQPVYLRGDNHRMAVVRQIMETAVDSGMKMVLGRPFTRFESADAAFRDEEATRPQELLGLDVADRFGPAPEFVGGETSTSHLQRALQLFRIMSIVGNSANLNNQYLQLDRDEFHSLVDFAVVNHDYPTQLEVLETYLETYHTDALMEMRTVAERGIDLFGQQYDSKYKQTKVFREALDAFLAGKSQRMEESALHEYVESQVFAAADREDYAGHATPAEATAFVEAIQSYLDENDLDDLKKLSDWENALVNSYYYAYQRALDDR